MRELIEMLGFWIDRSGATAVLREVDGGCHPATRIELALWDALEAAREDAERLMYLATDGCVEGFVSVEPDIYDYACDVAEESGRDEPNDADMLGGIRRLIDAAIDQARGKGGGEVGP